MPNFAKTFTVAGRQFGPGLPALLVAEIGGNHGGDLALAETMVEAAARSGAGGIKFQAYKTSRFLSPRSPYYDELAQEELAFEKLRRLVTRAKRYGLAAGITVFDSEGLKLARHSGIDFIKIASGDLTNHHLLREAARSGKPLFVSTGASMASEVECALEHLAEAAEVVVMQCAALYPAPLESANLGVILGWQAHGLLTGFSDHTLGMEAAQMALALGAVVLEKHFTIDRRLPGGDNAISAKPKEWQKLAAWAELCPKLLGQAEKAPHSLEWNMRPLIRRVLVANKTMKAGRQLTEADVAFMRPPPMAGAELLGLDQFEAVLGRTLKSPVAKGMPLTWADLDEA